MFWRAVFLLVGTTIGAGIFALPYAFLVSGPFWASLGLVFLAGVTFLLDFFYLKVITATPNDHQLPGYAHYWLGEKGKKLALITITLSSYGALLVYIILGGDFLALFFGQSKTTLHPLFFYLLGSWAVYRGLKTLTRVETLLTLALIFFALAIPLLGNHYFSPHHLSLPPQDPFFFYGPLFFALAGLAVIPEVEEVLRKNRPLLPAAIATGIAIPALVYLVFALGVLGISGPLTTADALSGLTNWSPSLVQAGALVGVLATFTSFISLTNVVKEVFYRDYHWQKKSALAAALLPPAIAIFFPLHFFLKIISFTGGVTIGLNGIIVCLMALKTKTGENKNFRWLLVLLIFFLSLGIGETLTDLIF